MAGTLLAVLDFRQSPHLPQLRKYDGRDADSLLILNLAFAEDKVWNSGSTAEHADY